MPRVLLEAMAGRKPIIAAAVGGIPYYMVDDDNALLFEAENVEQLAAKLSILMGDPELQARLGDRGYQKYSPNMMSKHTYASFKNVAITGAQ